jgi:hypothetical protein
VSEPAAIASMIAAWTASDTTKAVPTPVVSSPTNNVPSVATPSARPDCCTVVTTPPPTPTRCSGTSSRISRKRQAKTSAWPAPASTSPGANAQ